MVLSFVVSPCRDVLPSTGTYTLGLQEHLVGFVDLCVPESCLLFHRDVSTRDPKWWTRTLGVKESPYAVCLPGLTQDSL